MPTPNDVRTELADILTQVQGCEPDAVQPNRKLKQDLGVDSITIVEIGEELGRRFNIYLTDDAIDSFVTVKDAINAVVHHDGSVPKGSSPAVPAKLATPAPPAPPAETPPTALERVRSRDLYKPQHDPARVSAARRLALWMAMAGAALGVVIGMGSAAVIAASGLGDANLPPLSVTTATPTEEAPTTKAPAPEPTGDTPSQEPTMQVSDTRVSPGERFRLEGAFPALGGGATLQVQVKDPGGSWDDFPVDTKTKDGGAYVTEIYTSRTGKRQFRMFHKESSKASPTVTVEIG